MLNTMSDISTIALEELHDIFEDEKQYFQKKYNCIIYPNQLDILNTIANPVNHYINIVQSRGAGKSRGTALAFVNQCIDISELKVAIFAPKSGQSKRLLTEMYEIISKATQEVKDAIDHKNSSSMVLTFKNGSKCWALSGNAATMSEGEHPNCFDGETIVDTEKNKIKIKDIVENKLNIKVKCYNEKTGELEYKQITGWHKNKIEKRKILKIKYQFCALKLIDEIICTEDHEIFSNNCWTKAKQLSMGDKLYGAESNIKSIDVIKTYKENYVYDITVKGNHNYFANNILVHNCIVLDESQFISDHAWSSKISPMLGAHGYYQVVKVGVAMGNGHFNKGFNDKKYINLVCDWIHADRLKESGIFLYTDKNGVTIEYPKYAMEALMPPGAKKKLFPDRPDLITGPGEVSELDWIMQFECKWVDDISLYLSSELQTKLASGSHKLQITPLPNGVYVFGLDTASGSPNMETLGLDYTALSIWEIRQKKVLKVYSRRWQGDPLVQYDEILMELKKWKVKYGMIDFSSLAYMLVSMLQRDGIKCEGIQYHASCPDSHKDWKTTIFENFTARLNLDQVYYPKLDEEDYKEFAGNYEMKLNLEETNEAFYEWCILQRTQKKGTIKVTIGAPSKCHDDLANSDSLAVYASTRPGAQMAGGNWIIGMASQGSTFFSGSKYDVGR